MYSAPTVKRSSVGFAFWAAVGALAFVAGPRSPSVPVVGALLGFLCGLLLLSELRPSAGGSGSTSRVWLANWKGRLARAIDVAVWLGACVLLVKQSGVQWLAAPAFLSSASHAVFLAAALVWRRQHEARAA